MNKNGCCGLSKAKAHNPKQMASLRGWLILFFDSITESLDLDVCEEQYGRDGRDTDGPSSGQLLCATLQPL